MSPLPPKPVPRAARVSLWRHLRLFRVDILSAQPARLYRAWMADFRTPFFRSVMVNDPALLRLVLKERPRDFPKSDRIAAGLRPLLGHSVFLTNGEQWERQRRIIDPAFEGGRLRESFAAMLAAGEAAAARLAPLADGRPVDIEPQASHAAADVIFRTLFSIPIEHEVAAATFAAFHAHQRSQPLLNLAAFVKGPSWMPRLHSRRTRATAREIRALIAGLVEARARDIAEGRAPSDLATKIMTTPDPESGETFSSSEMVDQVAIFFLAGHETSAASLAWTLYLLATHPELQERAAEEARGFDGTFSALSGLRLIRDVTREALRLYPPVPMMVREMTRPERFRDRALGRGTQVVLSPWHLHRHERLWRDPDVFDPDRWSRPEARESARAAYMPFSAGPRVCPGAGFAMAEAAVLLAALLRRYRFEPVEGDVPVPVAQLTVRSKGGIRLRVTERGQGNP
ncbi:cytochrome P450 [Limimaricola variabilis]|uniref:cytochrome P450 n=1 Tax=Limimaricola variabilis TaxID=1492771 RepID=UPI002AC96674|nr:cytochrome P450 [Limimaricola variabilis]WPY94816.1 cytochrome P450 [Limimaricola variabilis]